MVEGAVADAVVSVEAAVVAGGDVTAELRKRLGEGEEEQMDPD